MQKFFLLKNRVQNYAWGSHSAIYELLGEDPQANKPAAELWMGAHPQASSLALLDNQEISLYELIRKHPLELLGKECIDEFGGRLPFLFKVLAANLPLSIQAHPDLVQAREGFRRENEAGIALDAFNRTYKDDNHKPEIICALTPYWALNGFLPYPEILSFFERLKVPYLKKAVSRFAQEMNPEGLKTYYRFLWESPEALKQQLVADILAYAEANRAESARNDWLVNIHSHFPGDPGLISAALLNLVLLQPGEAMYLPARQLHAYLQGVGVELMANSDNVLRGGLTAKYVNVPELLQILHFEEKSLEILHPQKVVSGEQIYRTPTREFSLSRLQLSSGKTNRDFLNSSVAIMLCVRGQGRISDPSGTLQLSFKKGQSFLISASVDRFQLQGDADLFAARMPGRH